MDTKDKKVVTLNQYNIVGKKLDIDFNKIRAYKNLEEITLKNFEITEEIVGTINELENLNSVFLVNCKINSDIPFINIKTIELVNCLFNKNLYSSNIKRLYIDSCNQIDITEICNLELNSLRIENTKVENLNQISELTSLENLYLNAINLNEGISFEKLKKLKILNFDGSIIGDKEKFLDQFKGKNIEVSFTKENKRIG